MLRRPYQWMVKSLDVPRRGEGFRLSARVKFLGGDGANHQTEFSDFYDGEGDELERLDSFLYAIRLFPTDVLMLIEQGRLHDAMVQYLAIAPRITATCQIRPTGARGIPYGLYEHRPINGQAFDRDSIGLPSAQESYEATKAWIASKSNKPSGDLEQPSPATSGT